MSIIIENSLDKPFGKLANDALVPFKSNSRLYSSVVNYVYANLLPDSTFKEELSHSLPKNVLKTFECVRKHLKQSTIQFAAYTAISEKAKQDKNFFQRLMDTESDTILYYSQNSYLGVGKSKGGENIYGQALERYRNEARLDDNKGRQNDNIYHTYIAELNLKKAFHTHNLERYISKDSKRSIKRLLDTLVREYGKDEVYSKVPDIETILTLHEKRNIIAYTDPNSLIRVIRKNEVRNVLKKNLFELKKVALQYFVDYVTSKKITLSEDKMAIKDQIFDILPSKRDEFSNRILDLFSAKALSEEVGRKIKELKSRWYFPSDKDIEFFETESIKLPNPFPTATLEKNVFKVYYDDILSPLNDTSTLVVNNLEFKSISHYIAFELNKLYGQVNPNKLYIRMKDVKTEDLEKYSKMFEKDIFTTTKNKLLEDAITIKLQENTIKNLLFSLSFETLQFEDSFNLDRTQELYNKYKDKINLPIYKIPSFEAFIQKDPFMVDVIKDKIDFYFTILDNLMVHLKFKNKLQVSYESLVEMSAFYSYIMVEDSSVAELNMPAYLFEKNKTYGLTNRGLLQVWSIVFNGLKQSEKLVGKNTYDIRYKNLFIWAKYFLGKPDKLLKTFQVMQSRQEDTILVVLLAILSTLKEVNLKFGASTINKQDLQTAVHLCLSKVRVYEREFAQAQVENAEFEDEVNPYEDEIGEVLDDEDEPGEIDVYGEDEDDDQNFEGFNLSSRMKFEAFLSTYFDPLLNELDLRSLEDAVYKILNSKITITLKHQNLNFFSANFKIPSL